MQLLQYEVSCPIAIKKCHHTLAFCKFCHRFVDPCTFYCNGVVITCAKKIDNVCPPFYQYYPGRVKDPCAARQLRFAKACELARFARIINVLEHLVSLTYSSGSPVLDYLLSAVNYDLLLYSSNVIDSNQTEFSRKRSYLVNALYGCRNQCCSRYVCTHRNEGVALGHVAFSLYVYFNPSNLGYFL